MSGQENRVESAREREQQALNKRLERIGWALFLIMIGGIGLVPEGRVPEGTWLVGVGLIMLGLNAARSIKGIQMSGSTLVLGILALIAGIGDLLGLDLPVLAILLIIVGASIILKPWLEPRLEKRR